MSPVPLISIVDDDDAVRHSLDDLIRSLGYRTQDFSSAQSFFNSREVLKTACLILDVRMPGVNGLDVQRNIIASQLHIPIIFITAHADGGAREQAMRAGAIAFLYKPFHEQDLVDAIALAVKHSETS
jgi:FixJ family two-component response regulator